MQKRAFKIWALLITILLLSAPSISAQEEEKGPVDITFYSLGQQTISFSAGLFIPLFYQSFGGDYYPANISLGGLGNLQWGAHLDNHWMIGLEIGGLFSISALGNVVLMLPMTFRTTFIFHVPPFELPIFIGVGMNISKYEAQTNYDFILKPGFSSLWKYNASWAFGLNFVYWWIPQPWPQNPDMGRMGNFLEISATAQYSF